MAPIKKTVGAKTAPKKNIARATKKTVGSEFAEIRYFGVRTKSLGRVPRVQDAEDSDDASEGG